MGALLMQVQLVVIEGRPLGAIIPVRPGQLVIGRDESCQLRPKSSTVSQFHCMLSREGDEVTVVDLGSSNGTLVNDHFLHKGEARRLSDGDRLQVGQLSFAFRTSGRPYHGEPLPEDLESQIGPNAEGDPNSQTLLMSALCPAGQPNGFVTAARPKPSFSFAYRELHPENRAMSIGLSWAQMADEEARRSTRKALGGILTKLPSRRIVLDLSELDELPSLAVATVVALGLRCRRAGGGLRLCGLRPCVKRMMTSLKLDNVVRQYATRDAALIDPWD